MSVNVSCDRDIRYSLMLSTGLLADLESLEGVLVEK